MPSYRETKRHIESFRDLPEGWYYGEGVPPSMAHIEIMADLLLRARFFGFETFEAFPGVDGEIQLAIYDAPNFYSITIESDAEFTVRHEMHQAEVCHQEHVTFYDAVAKLEEFAFQIWNTRESFTLPKFPPLTVDLATLPLRNPLTAQESPALRSNVRLPKAEQFASTSPITTKNLLAAIQSSIGSYQTVPS